MMGVSGNFLVSVIDDDDSFRTGLVEALRSLDYDARGFESAEGFIARDAKRSYDCVITDVHMPGMSGLDLNRLLAARGATTPVILITARTEPELEAQAAAAGAVCLLRKPFATDDLIKCLERALQR
jgi:FixJ family two-component response regulator